MTHDFPLSPHPLTDPARGRPRVLTAAQLRARGVTAAETDERCRPGGPWQRLLPGVVLLRPGPPTGEEKLHAVLLYAARARAPRAATACGAPVRPGLAEPPEQYAEAVITGLAALALHGVRSAPPPASLAAVDVLVPRLRRLRSTGCARIVRTAALPTAVRIDGVPVAPVARALADAVAGETDGAVIRRLLADAVRGGHCDPAAAVRELNRARLLDRPQVVAAVDSLVAEGRALAEDRLYRMVRSHGLPDPLWNVDLRLPGGPHLGGLDAYWPEQAVALELRTRAHRRAGGGEVPEPGPLREHLERLGITVVRITPRALREAPDQQATVVRTALMAAADREPAAYVVVLPR